MVRNMRVAFLVPHPKDTLHAYSIFFEPIPSHERARSGIYPWKLTTMVIKCLATYGLECTFHEGYSSAMYVDIQIEDIHKEELDALFTEPRGEWEKKRDKAIDNLTCKYLDQLHDKFITQPVRLIQAGKKVKDGIECGEVHYAFVLIPNKLI